MHCFVSNTNNTKTQSNSAIDPSHGVVRSLYAFPCFCRYPFSCCGSLSTDSRVSTLIPFFSGCYPLHGRSRPDISHMASKPSITYGFLTACSAANSTWPTFSSVYPHPFGVAFSTILEPITDRFVFFMLTVLQTFLTTHSVSTRKLVYLGLRRRKFFHTYAICLKARISHGRSRWARRCGRMDA